MKVVAEEEAAKKFASKLWKGQKVKKKAVSEKSSFECPGDTCLLQERVSIEVEPSANNVILVPEDQSLVVSADTSLTAPEFRMDVDM